MFLRFPGQWDDGTWADATLGADVYYNVHRWYQHGTGRYSKPDPWGMDQPSRVVNLFVFAASQPSASVDDLGLFVVGPSLGGLFDSAFDCFYCLLARSDYGITPYEQCAWLSLSPSLTFECEICPPVRRFAECSCPGRGPGSTLVHTHPTRSRTSRTGAEPSPHDRELADSRGFNIIVVSPDGIWIHKPHSDRPFRLVPRNWWKRPGGPKDRNCQPCKGIQQP